ncbi:MAG: hypothetical protein SFY92_07880 [Verrucomicrobiae bacterium]|nr:hypothetical protein [Verrucomicrobiae bacterium]
MPTASSPFLRGSCLRTDSGPHHVVITPRQGGISLTLSAALWKTLNQKSEFSTLPELIECQNLEPEEAAIQRDEFARIFRTLYENDIILSPERLLTRIGPRQTSENRAEIGWLCCPSRNNPDQAFSTLSPLIESIRQWGHPSPSLALADNSPSPDTNSRYRDRLGKLSQTYNLAVWHATPHSLGAYAKALAEKSGVPIQTTDFALLDPMGIGFTCGASRNALLLQSAGSCLASVDDDIMMNLRSLPRQDWHFTGIAGVNQWPHLVGHTPQSVTDKLESTEFDSWAHFQKHLGAAPPPQLKIHSQAHIPPGLMDDLPCMAPRIRVMYASYYGFLPFHQMLFRYQDSATFFSSLQSAGSSLDLFLTSPHIASMADGNILSPSSLMAGMFFGLDARGLCPPFMPGFHLEDNFFGALLGHADPAAWSTKMPVAVQHSPTARHPLFDLELYGPHPFYEVSQLLTALLRSIPIHHFHSRESAFPYLAGKLRTLCPGSVDETMARLDECSLKYLGDMISNMEANMADSMDHPESWNAQHAAFVDGLIQNTLKQNWFIPPEIIHRFGSENAPGVLHTFLRRYADLIEAWPTLWNAAIELREQGIRPAEKI